MMKTHHHAWLDCDVESWCQLSMLAMPVLYYVTIATSRLPEARNAHNSFRKQLLI